MKLLRRFSYEMKSEFFLINVQMENYIENINYLKTSTTQGKTTCA